ncbi:uncharacterized protein TRIADDRAFT_18638, partial [Trichoplax adhaerens]
RAWLKQQALLHDEYKVKKMNGNLVALPLCNNCTLSQCQMLDLNKLCLSYRTVQIPMRSLQARKYKLDKISQPLHQSVAVLYEKSTGIPLTANLAAQIPNHWIKHGDMIVLPANSFTAQEWLALGDELWHLVCSTLGAKRLAKNSAILNDNHRTPNVEMLLGDCSWVTHMDNGIKYTFDITKCMFSPGNITEKIRISNFDCSEEIIVDLYAGIGYFVLPYLIHAKAKFVHACEWNPHAVEALEKSLILNKVREKCTVYFGDNRQHAPKFIADRVNLGLLPTSRPGWHIACAALRPDRGGWLHVHGNVNTYKVVQSERKQFWQQWGEEVASELELILNQMHSDKSGWKATCKSVTHVKRYAPHIDHLIADVHCTV